jgi:hypothetical protein
MIRWRAVALRIMTVRTPEFVQVSLEWLAWRAALDTPRNLVDALIGSSVVWREPGDSCARLIVIEKGEAPSIACGY